RSRRESQFRHPECSADRPAYRGHTRSDHFFDFACQRVAVLPRQFESAARIGILICAAKGHKQCSSAGMLLFDRLRREPRVVSAELVELSCESRIVAGVAEDDAANLAGRIRNL